MSGARGHRPPERVGALLSSPRQRVPAPGGMAEAGGLQGEASHRAWAGPQTGREAQQQPPVPPRPASPCLPWQALPLNASLRGTERAEAQKIFGNILRPQKEHAGECGWTSGSRALGEVAGLSPRRWERRCTRTCGDPGFFWKGRDSGDSKGPCPPPRGLFPHPACLPSRSPCLYPPETESFTQGGCPRGVGPHSAALLKLVIGFQQRTHISILGWELGII